VTFIQYDVIMQQLFHERKKKLWNIPEPIQFYPIIMIQRLPGLPFFLACFTGTLLLFRKFKNDIFPTN